MLEFVEVLVEGEEREAALRQDDDGQQDGAKKERKPRNSVKGYIEDVVENYSNDEFRREFRMDRETVKKLTALFENSDWSPKPAAHGGGREIISAEKHILVYLWYVGHRAANYREVVERFDLSQDALSKLFARVNKFLFSLSKDVIQWPSRPELKSISEGFKAKSGLPNVYGCVGITHVRIEKPLENSEAYRNQDQNYSIQVQAICDDTGKFSDVFFCTGSAQNVKAMKNFFIYPTLPLHCAGGYIVADGSYALKPWCLVPYYDEGSLTDLQQQFNFKLNGARMEIKRSLRRLKERFPIMHSIPFRRIDFINDMIMGCFVLYNWDFRIEDDELPEGDEHNYNRPLELSCIDEGIPNEENNSPPREAVALRDRITEQLGHQDEESIDETILALTAVMPEEEKTSSDRSMPDVAVRLLISTYADFFKYQKPGTKKFQIWQRVEALFQAKGYSYPAKQLLNKWRTLERGFKRAVANAKLEKRGRGQVTCRFQRELEDVLATCPNIFIDFDYATKKVKRKHNSPRESQKREITTKHPKVSKLENSLFDNSEAEDDESNLRNPPSMSWHLAQETDPNSTSQELLVQELAKFRKTFQIYCEKKEKQRQLRHAEKLQLLRNVMGIPSTQHTNSRNKIKRYKK